MVDLDATYNTEAELLAEVKKYIKPLERHGVVMLSIRDTYTIGYSDLFLCVRGRFVVAELKDNTNTATPHQKKFVARMKRAGALGKAECRSVRDVVTLINQAIAETDIGREWDVG